MVDVLWSNGIDAWMRWTTFHNNCIQNWAPIHLLYVPHSRTVTSAVQLSDENISLLSSRRVVMHQIKHDTRQYFFHMHTSLVCILRHVHLCPFKAFQSIHVPFANTFNGRFSWFFSFSLISISYNFLLIKIISSKQQAAARHAFFWAAPYQHRPMADFIIVIIIFVYRFFRWSCSHPPNIIYI